QPAQRNAFNKAARHTKFVRRLRWLLPVAALFIAIVFIGISYITSMLANLDLGSIELDGTSLVLQKPKIAGFDKHRRAYNVTAEKAKQSITSPKQVELTTLEARMELIGNGWAKLTSDHGLFDGETERVQLDGNIHVTSSQGYDMRLEAVDIDMKSGALRSDKPVIAVQGENRISSDALTVSDGGGLIRFEGRVRAELNAAKALDKKP
ncbi:MAG: LPS export ABC transporter periplasmic protein LptC, partial [Pseudomonadota bacterium]